MKELVTVIIPVYQVEEYLEDCIKSIICQTYSKLEIILVDDGSTDGSAIICDRYKEKDARIRVVHKANGGLSSARNVGIDICKGKYVTFVDSDDVVADVMIEEMLNIAKQEHADVVKVGVIRKNNYSENIAIPKNYMAYSGNEAVSLIFKSNSQIICGCGKLFTREVIGNIRFPDGRYYEDEYFTPRIYLNARKVVLSDSEYYFYMQRKNDSILRGKMTEKKVKDAIWISRDRIELFRSLGRKKLEREAIVDYYYKFKHLLNQKCEMDFCERRSTKEYLLTIETEYKKAHPFLYCVLQTKGFCYSLIKSFSSSKRKRNKSRRGAQGGR